MNQRNGYSAQAMPELAVKIKIALSSNNTTMSGMSHHFFSCRENLKNSLRSDHMICFENWIHARSRRSAVKIFHDGLGARVDVQFFINRPHIAAHRVNADVHAVGDFLIGVALGELIQKFPFRRREFGQPGTLRGRPGKKLHHAPRELRRHRGTAVEHILDGFEQARGGGALEQITDRKSTRLNSSLLGISYAVFCLKKNEEGIDATVDSFCRGNPPSWLGLQPYLQGRRELGPSLLAFFIF